MSFLQTAAQVIFWLSLAGLFFTYAGYPFIIWCCARLFGKKPAPPARTDDLPRVSLLIAAYNEEAVIAERIDNALRLDYPADKLEIVIASDGSSDATNDIVRRYAPRGVRLLAYPARRGKATVLNDSVPRLSGDIVIFSDANTFFDPDAARRLVRWFHDPRVGMVCGRLVLIDPQHGRNVDGLYWKYETFLKQCENRLGALLGANGAIYAVRRPLYRPIPANTILDDLLIPLLAVLRSGKGLLYDDEAVAREETPPHLTSEFHRRARIGAGGFQSIFVLWKLLHPRHGWLAFSFFSHKVLRWFSPFLLIILLLSNALLLTKPWYQFTMLGQLGFYLLSSLVYQLPSGIRLFKPLRMTTMFTGMNLALMVGFWRWLKGNQKGTWKRTERSEAAVS
ncbi:MAG: glycosyltransferase family 2 protein [Gemmataceae bacterium]